MRSSSSRFVLCVVVVLIIMAAVCPVAQAEPVSQGGTYVKVLRQITVDVTAAGGKLMNNWQAFVHTYYPAWTASYPMYQAGRWIVTLSRYTYVLQNAVPLYNQRAYCATRPWESICPRPQY